MWWCLNGTKLSHAADMQAIAVVSSPTGVTSRHATSASITAPATSTSWPSWVHSKSHSRPPPPDSSTWQGLAAASVMLPPGEALCVALAGVQLASRPLPLELMSLTSPLVTCGRCRRRHRKHAKFVARALTHARWTQRPQSGTVLLHLQACLQSCAARALLLSMTSHALFSAAARN